MLNLNIAYKQQLEKIMTSDEIDKLIKAAPFREKRRLRSFKDNLLRVAKDGNTSISALPIMPLILMNDSPSLWQDIFCYMMGAGENKEQ